MLAKDDLCDAPTRYFTVHYSGEEGILDSVYDYFINLVFQFTICCLTPLFNIEELPLLSGIAGLPLRVLLDYGSSFVAFISICFFENSMHLVDMGQMVGSSVRA